MGRGFPRVWEKNEQEIVLGGLGMYQFHYEYQMYSPASIVNM